MSCIVVHYKEIGIKGRNRIVFERRLMEHIGAALADISTPRVHRFHGRLVIEAGEAAPGDIDERLAATPGIANFAHARLARLDAQAITEQAVALAQQSPAPSFRIQTRRSNKRFPLTSMQLNAAVGQGVRERTGKRVRLEDPELTVFVEVTEREALVYSERRAGLGGLPVGMSGRLVGLLSGGIDSPVAAFKMIRRGARVVLLHFHNYSRYQDSVRAKLIDLARVLNRFQLGTRLYVVPFARLQESLIAAIPAPSRMVAYRRAMFTIGGRVLERERASGFVTGDSLGQVASQTIDNLTAIQQAASAPVFSPLIAEDKQTIVDLAKAIGTYAISIRPYEDCCSFLVAKHPDTRVALEGLQALERRLALDELAEAALAEAEIYDFSARFSGSLDTTSEVMETGARSAHAGDPSSAAPRGSR